MKQKPIIKEFTFDGLPRIRLSMYGKRLKARGIYNRPHRRKPETRIPHGMRFGYHAEGYKH